MNNCKIYTSLNISCLEKYSPKSPNADRQLLLGRRAWIFLKREFKKIGGFVRVVTTNDYENNKVCRSFEIDYPAEIEKIKNQEKNNLSDKQSRKLESWHEEADSIKNIYNKKFNISPLPR